MVPTPLFTEFESSKSRRTPIGQTRGPLCSVYIMRSPLIEKTEVPQPLKMPIDPDLPMMRDLEIGICAGGGVSIAAAGLAIAHAEVRFLDLVTCPADDPESVRGDPERHQVFLAGPRTDENPTRAQPHPRPLRRGFTRAPRRPTDRGNTPSAGQAASDCVPARWMATSVKGESGFKPVLDQKGSSRTAQVCPSRAGCRIALCTNGVAPPPGLTTRDHMKGNNERLR